MNYNSNFDRVFEEYVPHEIIMFPPINAKGNIDDDLDEYPPAKRRIVEAMLRLISFLITGMEIGRIGITFYMYEVVSIIILDVEDIREHTGQVAWAGSPGSGILFVHASEYSSDSPVDYLKAKVQKHLAVTPKLLVIATPTPMLQFLIADALPKGMRKRALEYWKEIQRNRESLCQEQQEDTAQQCTEDTESTPWVELDWQYHKGFIDTTQSFVPVMALCESWNTEEIHSMLRVGRMFRDSRKFLPAVPDNYSNGVLAAGFICGSGMAMESMSIANEDDEDDSEE
jgi:hypothetical protein